MAKNNSRKARKDRKINSANERLRRYDSWANAITGTNTSRDRKTGNAVSWAPLTEQEASQLYAGDRTSSKIVNTLPAEMLKNGFTLNHNSEDKELETKIFKELEKLEIMDKIKTGLIEGRLHGGAALILGTSEGIEGGSFDQELQYVSIDRLHWVLVANRWNLKKHKLQEDVTKPHYGEPETYMFSDQGKSFEVHRSRLCFFHGVKLPKDLYKTNNYWHDSVLNNIKQSVSNYNQTHDNIATMFTEYLQKTMTLKGLSELIASGQGDLVRERIELINLYSSSLNMSILDEGESIDRTILNLAGVADVANLVNNRLVADTDLPHTVILGESPGGMGSNGNHELKSLYDKAKSAQTTDLLPVLTKIIKVLLVSKSGPTSGIEPTSWGIEFEAIDVPSDNEVLDMEKKKSDIDKNYWEMNVLNSDEIRGNRFSGGSFNYNTILDREIDINEELESEDVSTGALGGVKDDVGKGLNGAQMRSALEVITSLKSGALDEEQAIELISVLGVPKENAKKVLGIKEAI